VVNIEVSSAVLKLVICRNSFNSHNCISRLLLIIFSFTDEKTGEEFCLDHRLTFVVS
jgi:hypothetical protein